MVANKHILFIVENNAAPDDVRVWSEALEAKKIFSDVSIISPISKRYNKRYEIIDNIEIYRHTMMMEANSKIGFIFEYLSALINELYLGFKIFVKKPFSILHSANPPDHIFIIALIFKIFGVKFVFDHHDLTPENYEAKFMKKDFIYRILLLMERLTFMTSDLVISTNESYKKIAVDRGKKKSNEVFVVRNGPDISKIMFFPPNNKLKENFQFLVAYLGSIGNQERIDILLRSIRHIVYHKKVNNIKFIIIGEGPHLKKMIALSKELKIQKYVTFTGYIPYKDLYEILSTADVCVNPEIKNSFTDQSTMIKIMDYMTFGKPIIQFNVTEGKVTAGDASIYIKDNNVINFAETIIKLCKDPDKRKRMGEIGKKRIFEKLSWNKQKVNLLRAYYYLDNRLKYSENY